jgi:hypothetical protein
LVRLLLRGLLRILNSVCYCRCCRHWSVGSSTSLCPATALVVPPAAPLCLYQALIPCKDF